MVLQWKSKVKVVKERMKISCHTPEDMLKSVSWWIFNDNKLTRYTRGLPCWDGAWHVICEASVFLCDSSCQSRYSISINCLGYFVKCLVEPGSHSTYYLIIYNNVGSNTEWIKGKGLASWCYYGYGDACRCHFQTTCHSQVHLSCTSFASLCSSIQLLWLT